MNMTNFNNNDDSDQGISDNRTAFLMNGCGSENSVRGGSTRNGGEILQKKGTGNIKPTNPFVLTNNNAVATVVNTQKFEIEQNFFQTMENMVGGTNELNPRALKRRRKNEAHPLPCLQRRYLDFMQQTKSNGRDEVRFQTIPRANNISPEAEAFVMELESFQVYIQLNDCTTVHVMSPGYRYNDVCGVIYRKYGLIPEELTLRMEGRIVTPNTVFVTRSHPYFVDVSIDLKGGSRRREQQQGYEEMQHKGFSNNGSGKNRRRIDKDFSFHTEKCVRKYYGVILDGGELDNERTIHLDAIENAFPYECKGLWTIMELERIAEHTDYDTSSTDNAGDKGKQENDVPPKKKIIINKKPKPTVDGFSTAMINQFTGASGVATNEVITRSRPHTPDPKVGCSMVAPQLGDEDMFQMVKFEYEIPESWFFLFDSKTIKCQGELPKFARAFINNSAGVNGNQVNNNNLMIKLFRSEFNERYVQNMTNAEVRTYKKNVLAYQMSVQHDLDVVSISRMYRLINASRIENSVNVRSDKAMGATLNNVLSTVSERSTWFLTKVFVSAKKCVDKTGAIEKIKSMCGMLQAKLGVVEDLDYVVETQAVETTVVKPAAIQSLKLDEDGDEVVYRDFGIKDVNGKTLLFPVKALVSNTLDLSTDQLHVMSKSNDELVMNSLPTLCVLPLEEIKSFTQSLSHASYKKQMKKRQTKKDNKKTSLFNQEPDGPMCIFPSFPNFSIYFEEAVKSLIPFKGGAYIIGWIDDWVHSSEGRVIWHVRSMKFAFMERVTKHKAYNLRAYISVFADSPSESNLVELANSQLLTSDLLEPCQQPDVNNLNSGTCLHSMPLPIIPRDWQEHYPGMHVDNCSNATQTKEADHVFYPLGMAVTNKVTFAGTLENMQAMLWCRLLVPRSFGPVPGLWEILQKDLPLFCFDFKPDHSAWFKNLDTKKKAKVLTWIEALIEGKQMKTDTDVFVKVEFLMKEKKGYPRPIFNISSKYLLLLGDFLQQLAAAVVENLFPCTPTYTISSNNTFYYSSKFSSKKMDNFVNLALAMPDGCHSLVLGDDTATIDRDTGAFIETDYSAYDSTQVKGESLEVFPDYIERLGFPKQAGYVRDMYEETVNYKHKKSSTKIQMPDDYVYKGLQSGDPATGLRNSLTNIIATNAVLEGECSYIDLGLVVKKKVSLDFDITFLKGIWLLGTDDNYHWTRLPSYIIFFKSMKNPKTLYNKGWTIQHCEQQLFWSMWLGFGNYETNWFTKRYGQFLKKLCPYASSAIEYSDSEYKVYSDSSHYISDETYDAFLFSRYGIDRNESEELLEYLENNVVSVPFIFQHPVVDKLVTDL
jgi:hypothetical protein